MKEFSSSLLIKYNEKSANELIPLECFLNRIFPSGFYENQIEEIVRKRAFKPRKDCESFYLSTPIDWDAYDKNSDRNWRMQLQGWAMFHPVMNFFDTYSNKEELVKYFFDIAYDWWQRYSESDERIVTSRMPKDYVWYDMSVGFRALVLAFFINRIRYFNIKVKEVEEKLLKHLALKHISNLTMPDVFSLNNHGFFQIQGLSALNNLFSLPEHSEHKEYCLVRMTELIKDQYTEEGVHKEHSPHYHFYTTDTCISTLKSGWYSEAEELNNIVRKASSVKAWLVDPLKRPVCVGDSIQTVQKSLTFPEALRNKSYIVGDFSKSGYSVVRSNWDKPAKNSSMLFFHGAYHSKSHKHRDCLSFELFENGKKIICDSGKYGYRSDKYRNYFLSNRAHNTLEIERFDILKIKPYGSVVKPIVEVAEDLFKLGGILDYPAVKFNRDIYYSPSRYLVIRDNVTFVKEHSVTSWLHLHKELSLRTFEAGKASFVTKDNREYDVFFSSPDFEQKYYYGDEKTMQGFVSENDYLYEPAPCIGFRKKLKKDTFATIITIEEGLELTEVIDEVKSKFEVDLPFKIQKETRLPYIVSSLKNAINKKFKEGDKLSFPDKKSVNLAIRNSVPFQFFLDNKKKQKTVIFLPGAINREKGCVDFQRHSWSESINANVISFSDPTINTENNLSIGWFQGKLGTSLINDLSKIILEIISFLETSDENVYIIGSSAGGFVSLKLSELFDKFNFLALNPQIFLDKYSYTHYEALLSYSYGNRSLGKDIEDIKKHIHVSDKIPLNPQKKTVVIVHNLFDEKHLVRHLNPYLKKLGGEGYKEINLDDNNKNDIDPSVLNIFYYQDKVNGHAPPSKSESLNILRKIYSTSGVFDV